MREKDTIIARSTAQLVACVQQNIAQDNKKALKPFLIAIDGPCASGKTTLAQALQAELSCPLISMDHFFLPGELRTADRLTEPGGNIHYERFEKEVLEGIETGSPFRYGLFDCKTMSISSQETIPKANLYLIEGSYSLHPRWRRRIDLAVFLRVQAAEQMRRLAERVGPAALASFENRWIPMENLYYSTFRICENADLVFYTDT